MHAATRHGQSSSALAGSAPLCACMSGAAVHVCPTLQEPGCGVAGVAHRGRLGVLHGSMGGRRARWCGNTGWAAVQCAGMACRHDPPAVLALAQAARLTVPLTGKLAPSLTAGPAPCTPPRALIASNASRGLSLPVAGACSQATVGHHARVSSDQSVHPRATSWALACIESIWVTLPRWRVHNMGLRKIQQGASAWTSDDSTVHSSHGHTLLPSRLAPLALAALQLSVEVVTAGLCCG